jgi:hypothetical protein
MIRLGTVLIALLASSLGFSATSPDGPTRVSPHCIDCEDWPDTEFCEWLVGMEDCHGVSFVYPGGEWDVFSTHEHEWYEEWGFAIELCDDVHEHGDCLGDEEEEDALEDAVDGLQAAATLSDAAKTLEAFEAIPGVWVELNWERKALQILSDGGCNPVPDGKVIVHLPVGEDMIGVWAAAFSPQS